MSPARLQQLTAAILDHSAEEGQLIITTIRSYLDTWEAFLQDRQQLRDHLLSGAGRMEPVAVGCRSRRLAVPRIIHFAMRQG